jgi:hypothetical protein
MIQKSIFIALSALLLVGSAEAVEGDTKIYISYKTKSVRVKPTAQVGGGVVDLRLVLHRNGSVDETSAITGGKNTKNGGRLGKQSKGAGYTVLDSSTITRTTDAGTYHHKLTVKVTGKNCMASIERTLKPGQKLYNAYSQDIKGVAYYSSIENEYTTCVIE